MTAIRSRSWPLVVLSLFAAAVLQAQDVASFEKRTTVKKLDNGLTIIILERHEAPVFSYATLVNAGSAQEVPGITGLAHMFEHMAFKGTDIVGTNNWAGEKAALQKVEETYAEYSKERRKTVGQDAEKTKAAEKAWRDAMAAADKFVVSDEFSTIVDRAGGVGMNAFTASDMTAYHFSMPSNRFELWAYLESSRFLTPVMREFYKERDVVQEERRLGLESSPGGRLFEQFVSTAFIAHPYGVPGIGWVSDLQSISASDAMAFATKYYVPANMTVGIVGDVNTAEAMPILEKYFGRLPNTQVPEELRTIEPVQKAERSVVLKETAQPLYFEGYHRPDNRHPDDPVYAVMEVLMSAGRTSRLYKSLVRDKKIAVQAQGFNGFPGEKYPNLFTFFAVTTPGHTAAELQEPIRVEVERLKNEDVPADELQSVKTRVKAGLLRQLDSNTGMALQLAIYQTLRGDWRELFREPEKIDKVTAADIRRVAGETFTQGNRTVAWIESVKAPAKGGAK